MTSNKTQRTNYDVDVDAVMALSEADKAYMAGYFDGEGSIGVYPKENGSLRIVVTVCQRKADTLVWYAQVFGGALVRVQRGEPRGNTYHEWKLENRSSIKMFLRQIGPYLRDKADQSDLVLDVINGKQTADVVDIAARMKREA